MYKGRGHNLPRSIAALRTVKRAFAACAVMAIVLGIVASLDSLIAGLRAPEGEIALVPGTSEGVFQEGLPVRGPAGAAGGDGQEEGVHCHRPVPVRKRLC